MTRSDQQSSSSERSVILVGDTRRRFVRDRSKEGQTPSEMYFIDTAFQELTLKRTIDQSIKGAFFGIRKTLYQQFELERSKHGRWHDACQRLKSKH